MPFSIYDFLENLCKEGRTFLAGVNEITFTSVSWNCNDILKVKDTEVKYV